ncbi:MAG: MFS transporter [Clostridiaceae bacterium]|jgi:MFS family permease|nr:MFS transporter [Clostridiaceae bacterium]
MEVQSNAARTIDATQPLKLDYKKTFKVGFAFAIIMIFWQAYDFVVPLLLENAYGLSNALRGVIMGLDNLLSLFLLPLFGRISDKSKGRLVKKFGRRTPFIVIGTVIAAALMILVPVSALNQAKRSDAIRADYEAQLNDDAFMGARLSEFYDNAVKNGKSDYKYCDLDYLAINKYDVKGGTARDFFTSIRYDAKVKTSGGFMGIGSVSYLYPDANGELKDINEILGETEAARIIQSNNDYKKYVESGMKTWISEQVNIKVTGTAEGRGSLALYMVMLLVVLIAMATFRSPAVALMPDVTPKPLRSQANAIINLCGGVGGAVAFLVYTAVLLPGDNVNNYVIIFGACAAAMLLGLAGFLALVREKKFTEECEAVCAAYGITDEDEEDNAAKVGEVSADAAATDAVIADATATNAAVNANAIDAVSADGTAGAEIQPVIADVNAAADGAEAVEVKKPKFGFKYKTKTEKARFLSFFLILASIFMWFMGYNAVSSSLSIYTTKALNLSAGVASVISGVSMGISALAFIPVGILAVKIGRKKSVMIGFALAILSFVLLYVPIVRANDKAIIPSVLFSVFYLFAGFGLIIANVNTLPMVVELAPAEDVGKYTGYYYTATMSAQAITPFIAGLIMDYINMYTLFLYSAVCIAIAIALMFFVRHGDSKQLATLSKEERKKIVLDAMD